MTLRNIVKSGSGSCGDKNGLDIRRKSDDDNKNPNQ